MSKKSKHHKPKGPKHPPQNTPPKETTPADQEQKPPEEPKPVIVAAPQAEIPSTSLPIKADIKPQPESVTSAASVVTQDEKKDDQPPVKPKRHRNRKKKPGDNTHQGDSEEKSPEPEKPEAKETKPVNVEKVHVKEVKEAQAPEKPAREKVESSVQCSNHPKKNVDLQEPAQQKQNKTEPNKKQDKNVKEDKKSTHENEPKKMPDIISTTTTTQPDINTEPKIHTEESEHKQNKNKKDKNKKGTETEKDITESTKKEEISASASKDISNIKKGEAKEIIPKEILPKTVIEEIKEVPKKSEHEEKKEDVSIKQSEESDKTSHSQKDKKSGKKGNKQKDHDAHHKGDIVQSEIILTPTEIENKQPVEVKETPKNTEKPAEDIMASMATSIEETLKKLIVCESDGLYGEQLLAKDKLAQEEHDHKSKSKKQHKHKEESHTTKEQIQHKTDDKNAPSKNEPTETAAKKEENLMCTLPKDFIKEENLKSEEKKEEKTFDKSKLIIVNLEECEIKKDDPHKDEIEDHDKKHKKGKKSKKDNKHPERTDSPLPETKAEEPDKNLETREKHIESPKITVPDDIIQALLSDDPPKFIDDSEKCSIIKSDGKEIKTEKENILKDEPKQSEHKKEKEECQMICEKQSDEACCKLTGATTKNIETENIHKKHHKQKGKHGKHEKETIDSASPISTPTEDKHMEEKLVAQILEEKPIHSEVIPAPAETVKLPLISEAKPPEKEKIEEKSTEEHSHDKNLEISKITDEAASRCSPKPTKRGKDKKHKHDKSSESEKSGNTPKTSESQSSESSSKTADNTKKDQKDSSEKTEKSQKDAPAEKDKNKTESKDSEGSPTSEENFEIINLCSSGPDKESLKPEEQPRERSPLKQNSKNLHGPCDIPVKSSKNDFKKERNKTPNHCDARKNLSDITDLPLDPGKCEKDKRDDSSGVIITEEACSTTLDDDEDTEFVYKYSFRVVYIPNACQVCKIQLKDERVVCQFCHLVGYCFEKHRDEDWSQHQSLCYAICTLTHVKALEHIYADAKGLNGQDYRLLRMQAIVSCEKLLKRKLCPWEQEVLLYPRICQAASCREWRSDLLKDCEKCGQVSYCNGNPGHLDENHKEWCYSYALYHALVNHQLTKGRIEPILPSRITNTDYLLPEKCSKLLEDLYGCVINMDECHYATLTQLSTAPLTALFSYQKAMAADKNIVKSMKDTFCIHVIGAELQFEADTPNKWEVFFLHMVPEVKELKIVFVGPELNVSKLPVELLTKIRMCPQCRFVNRRVKFEFHDEMLYHDFVESEQFSAPDFICAFNPGFHRLTGYAGLDTWPDTIKSALRLKVPLCCTAYTSAEAPRDLSRILECCGGPSAVKFLMGPKKNPYRSRRPDRNFVSDDDAPLIFKNYFVSLVAAV